MNKIKTIIADDQTLIRDGLASLLNINEEIEIVATASNGNEAINLAKKHNPDIILMDIRMPVMDGITALKKIKETNKNIHIIMLTTFDDDEYIIKSLKIGADGYLLKDIPTEDLVRAIKQVKYGTFQATNSIISRLSKILINSNKEDKSPNIQLLRECYQSLNKKEQQIFECLGEGKTNKEIASNLNLSEGTIKNYMTNILATFDTRDRTQLALLAYKLGFG
ncbi:MAG: response regulator transcription factor [Pleomorphochaeta sp.]